MPSLSILFKRTEEGIMEETLKEPEYFVDLNLNQIIDAITAGKKDYNLKPFFYMPLKDIDAILYRQEVMRDLENSILFEYIRSFSKKMNKARIYLALVDNLYYKCHKEGWFLEAVEFYCEAVDCLAHDLSNVELKSKGLLAIREYLISYAKSDAFKSLMDAIFLGKKMMERIMRTGMLCVCVTFIDELASMSEQTVSMVSTIVPENPALRTYKIVRRPADGLAYAISIAEKYRLTYDCLKERIKNESISNV